jgi:putative transposase
MWGRAKLGPIVRAEGFAASDATVRRIIQSLVVRRMVDPVSGPASAPRTAALERQTPLRGTSAARCESRSAGKPRATRHRLVNTAPDKAIEHFTAYDPIAKWTVAKALNRATAASAAIFLDKLVRDMPFKVEAIQVDGGPEFMADFEQACHDEAIRLYVLPPKCPQMNGAVERCNAAWRYEFYPVYELPRNVDDLNPILDSFQHLHNHHRPHGALGGLTPAQYLHILQAGIHARSQTS